MLFPNKELRRIGIVIVHVDTATLGIEVYSNKSKRRDILQLPITAKIAIQKAGIKKTRIWTIQETGERNYSLLKE